MMKLWSEYKPHKLDKYNFKKFDIKQQCMVEQTYIKAVMSFDTETTTFFKYENKWVSQNDYDPEKLSECEKYSLVYIWQFAIGDDVYYGRNIGEFVSFLEQLKKCNANDIAIIYVHNLGYDFSFIFELFKDNEIDVFARAKYKPIYIRIVDLGIEFRCSYFLTNMSLEDCAKQFKLSVQKCAGFLDYSKARTPNTKLNETELTYCEYDVRVINALIREVFLMRYKCVADIPLTQTGEVRRAFRRLCYKEKNYMSSVEKMKYNLAMYDKLTRVLQGGYTHLNAYYNGMKLVNVASYDISSSYPAEICTRKFPMSKFQITEKYRKSDMYCYLMYVEFRNIESKGIWSYIARHKADLVKSKIDPKTKKIIPSCDNGKIICAEVVKMWVTDVDYEIIIENYDFDDVIFHKIYFAFKDYLPEFMIRFTLERYVGKTTLKGISEFYGKYMRDKQQLNSIFGMTITNSINPEIVLDNENLEWVQKELTRSDIAKKIEDERPFLNFAWGIWITAYARADLWTVIPQIGTAEFRGMDCIYCDTDSVKIINSEKYTKVFKNYNSEVDKRVQAVCARYSGLNPELFRPKNKDGIEYPLGYFCYEQTYDEFVSLGSKKYANRTNGEFDCTVAGLRKKYYDENGVEQQTINSFDMFNIGCKILNGRTVHWHDPTGEIPNILYDLNGVPFKPHTKSGICMLNTYYTFSITEDYRGAILDARNQYRDYFRLV